MPHELFKLQGGVNTNQTAALNQTASIQSSQCIRFMPDAGDAVLVQKGGGWAKYFANQIGSKVRALWPWNDQNDVSHLAVCADQELAVITSGSLSDITPNTLTYSVPVRFTTIAGSSVVTITDGNNFAYATTGASGTGLVATILYTGAFIYPVGSSINITGVTPAGYNGNYTVTASSTGSVSFTSATTGAQTVAGTIQNQSATTAFDSVYVMTPVIVGGLTIFGLYPITPLTATTYSIVALDVFGVPSPAPGSTTTQATTVAAGTGTVATLTFAGPYTFPVGTQIVVAGVTPTAFNGTFIVTASTTTTVSYASTATGPQTVAGTVTDFGGLVQYSMTAGSPIVTVTFFNHGLLVGDSYPVTVPTTVNGLVISGEYNVVSVINSYQFTIRLGFNASGAPTISASGTGATATLTFNAGSYAFYVGEQIFVSGMTPAGYNGSYTVTAATANTVSYANATSGAQTVAGTIFASQAFIPQNSGNVQFEYFIGPTPTAVGAGFGVSGFGDGGFGVGIAPAPATGVPIVTTDWFPDNWGSILVACPNLVTSSTDKGSPLYIWDPTQSTPSAAIITQGPIKSNGCFVAMPQRQIICWGSTFNGVQDHLLIRWCDVEDFTTWFAQPQNQAGSYRIPRGSRIIGAMQVQQQGLIWTDIAVWSMQYIGQPYVYSFDEVSTGCGLISPKAMGTVNGVVYWMSQSQFFHMSGKGVEILQCDVWDAVFQNIDANHLDHIRCAPNSRFGEISWFIPIIGGNGENGLNVKYNAVNGLWDISVAPLTRTAWTNQSILGAPIGAGTDNYIYQHEFMNGQTLLNADTAPLISTFTTGWFALADGDVLKYLDQWWPDFQWGLDGGPASANIQITFNVAAYPGDVPVTYGPYTVTQATGYFTPRFRGRLIQMIIGSSDINSFWRIGANRYRWQADGKF